MKTKQQSECKGLAGRSVRPAKGFSLAEVLVVMTILAVLVAISLPVIGRMRQAADETTCANNLRQMGLAFSLYTQDHEGNLPPPNYNPEEPQSYYRRGLLAYFEGGENSVEALYQTQLICPVINRKLAENDGFPEVCNFSMNFNLAQPGTSGRKPIRRAAIGQPVRTVLASEAHLGSGQSAKLPSIYISSSQLQNNLPQGVHGERRNVLFVDGHVEAVRFSELVSAPEILWQP